MLEGLISKMNQYHHQPQQPLAHVMEDSLSNLTSASGEASNSSINPSVGEAPNLHPPPINPPEQNPPPNKKKRSLPGNPDPDSEVIALSPKSLLAKNRFLCEICNKGFQRDQNLQLHRRGHNLPWKLKQRSKTEVVRRKVYVCPETSCVHHDPSRALGDLTGIKKHFCRKHGEKKWKCEKCSKKYAVQSDWKAHSKICGTREYRCDCGTLFSRRDSFITHRAFCDVLAEEAARSTASNPLLLPTPPQQHHHQQQQQQQQMPRHHYNQYQQIFSSDQNPQLINAHDLHPPFSIKQETQQQQQQQSQGFNLIPPWLSFNQGSMQAPLQRNPSHGLLGGPTGCFGAPSSSSSAFLSQSSPQMSATALLQKAAQIGATMSSKITQAQQDQFQFPATSAGQQGPHDHVSAILTNTPTTTTAGFGLNLSPQDHHQQQQQQQQEMMNNAINGINGSGGVVVNGGGSNFASSSSPSLLLHDLMMNSLSSSFDGDDNPFANGGNDGLTRDFLGLRPLSTSDILSFAGFGNSMANLDGAPNNVSSSSVSHQDDLHDKSWQG